MTGNSISGYILPAFIPYTLSGKEPEDKYVLENEGKENAAEITFKRRGRTLFFENIISPAWL
ncbi:MAG: hypothetical protein LIO97_09930 [Tannerellaceae bacterium]|nr:hypothetical protein [Tannerellaceae bacterium]